MIATWRKQSTGGAFLLRQIKHRIAVNVEFKFYEAGSDEITL